MEIRPTGNNLTVPMAVDKGQATGAMQTTALKPAVVSTQPDAAVQQPAPNPPAAQVAEALKSINKTMQALDRNVEFSVDEETDRSIVKVVDQETGEIIRQMPTKETLEIAKALDRVQGLLIKQQA